MGASVHVRNHLTWVNRRCHQAKAPGVRTNEVRVMAARRQVIHYGCKAVFTAGGRREIRRVSAARVVTRIGAAIPRPDNRREGIYPVDHE
jgi:hypothetical protein